jgi:hypothetical protein
MGSGYPGAYINPGYGSVYLAASNSSYNSAYSGYSYPGMTSYSYPSYSGGYSPMYSYLSSSYGYPPYGVSRGTYLIRIR